MDTITNSLLIAHITAGFTSLILFWVPIFSRKGGRTHRHIGNYYVWAMWLVVISAALLSIKNLLLGNTVMGAFLGFLALISGKPLWLGISALNNKKARSESYRRAQLIMSGLVVISGCVLIGYGLVLGGNGLAVFMIIFGVLGLASIFDFVANLDRSAVPKHWLEEHIANMCITGIAAHTAFLAFGAQSMFSHLYSSYWSIVPWVAPTIIGSLGIRVAITRYKRKGRIPHTKNSQGSAKLIG
jgi:hypothetical protein